MPQKTTKPYEIYKRLFDIDAKPHKICIIGASGLTGLNITGIALNVKHEVIALVRSPQKFQNLIKDYLPEGQSTNKLSVLQCDLEHPNENLGKAIQFADTVIFSIANKNNMTDKAIGTPCTNGINAIVSLLKENPQTKKRFIFVSSSATFLEDLDKSGGMGSWFYKNVIIPKYMTETYDDLRYMELQIKEHLMNNPMYNVTVVRPPYLVEMKPEVKFKVEDKPIKAPKLGVLKLGRYQLAYFLVKSIDDESTFGKAQYLAAK